MLSRLKTSIKNSANSTTQVELKYITHLHCIIFKGSWAKLLQTLTEQICSMFLSENLQGVLGIQVENGHDPNSLAGPKLTKDLMYQSQ